MATNNELGNFNASQRSGPAPVTEAQMIAQEWAPNKNFYPASKEDHAAWRDYVQSDKFEASVDKRLGTVNWEAARPAAPGSLPKLDDKLSFDLNALTERDAKKATAAWEKHAPADISFPNRDSLKQHAQAIGARESTPEAVAARTDIVVYPAASLNKSTKAAEPEKASKVAEAVAHSLIESKVPQANRQALQEAINTRLAERAQANTVPQVAMHDKGAAGRGQQQERAAPAVERDADIGR